MIYTYGCSNRIRQYHLLATLPTVLCQSLRNLTHVLVIVLRCACCPDIPQIGFVATVNARIQCQSFFNLAGAVVVI